MKFPPNHSMPQLNSHSLMIMSKEASLCLLFLSSLLISSSGALVVENGGTISLLQQNKRVSRYLEARRRIASLHAELHTKEEFSGKELKREEKEVFPVSRREILLHTRTRRRTLDDTNTVYQTPIITPPDTPTIITVPSSTNPVTISPTNPAAAVPVNVPSTTPVPLPPTNPANNSPASTTPTTLPPPVTNPVTSYPPPSGNVPVPVPVTNSQPPPSTTSPQGGSWCVAKTGAPQASLQSALDYACGMGGADCSQIQQGASCYSPVTLQNHASFAFNSYYQKHPGPTSCDFGGAATLVNTNPSSGSCIFPSSSSSSSSSTSSSTPVISPPTQYSTPTAPPSPTTLSPSIPTTPPLSSIPTAPPTTSSGSSGGGTSGYGTPPSVLNSSNPASGTMPTGFGSDSPPVVNTTSAAHSLPLKPFNSCMVLMISLVTARLSMRP